MTAESSLRDRPLTGAWRILFPPGWVSIPTDPETSGDAIRRATSRAFQGLHRDELIDLRVKLDQSLRELVSDAHHKGVRAVHFLAAPIRGVAVSASLVATIIPTPGDDELNAGVSLVLGEAIGVQDVSRVNVGDLAALRRLRQVTESVQTPEGIDVEVTHTWIDYVCEASSEELLLLSFETSTVEISDALVQLFDAMAATVHRPG